MAAPSSSSTHQSSSAATSGVPLDPRSPETYQSAFEVSGASWTALRFPGDFLIVVDRVATDLPLRAGDVVLVMQSRGMREVTARRFCGSAPDCEDRFESNDPRFEASPPLRIRAMDPDISLGGIVVAVYRPPCRVAAFSADAAIATLAISPTRPLSGARSGRI